MTTETREVSTGGITGTYDLNMPESVAEFVGMLGTGDERQITVSLNGLKVLASYALKSWLIEQDNKARTALKEGPKSGPKSARMAVGF